MSDNEEYHPPRGYDRIASSRFEASKITKTKQLWLIRAPKSLHGQLPSHIPVQQSGTEVVFTKNGADYTVMENKEEEQISKEKVKILVATNSKGKYKQLEVPISKVIQISEIVAFRR
ncbi:uncharacterized protein V1516DRAFT_689037 [Lipomyces oligophaga]|uniref:uncharacterized protein n=1 Tax=Lipomyces oligophaga TaxID=45792 RepID=UPI0034CDB279